MLIRQQIALESKRIAIEGLKTQLIGSRGHVIQLQGKLLESKDEQLSSLQKDVQSAVQETVKTEIRSYGDAVKKNLTTNPPVSIPPQTLKRVVQNVIEVEDRSRNLLVFGLKEQKEEQVAQSVGDVFLQLGEKPRLEASRIGRKVGSSATCRPVKVTLSSSTL